MNKQSSQKVYFASGCFWSKEYYFSQLTGVLSTSVGYIGGQTANPTYQQVCTKKTGHAEAVEVVYNPSILPFAELCITFFENHDATIDRTNRGGQYRSAIFYTTLQQRKISEEIIQLLTEKELAVKTQIERATTFWQAEDRHQKYCEVRGFEPNKKGISKVKEIFS